MLIKTKSLAAMDRTPHKLGKKMGPGKYQVQHPVGCACQMVYTVQHAKWVNYYAMEGRAFCDHCKTELDLPLPAVRENAFSKRVHMDLKAIEDTLWNFQLHHENCPPPIGDLPCLHAPSSP